MSKIMEQAMRTLVEHRVNEVICNFSPGRQSNYTKAENRYMKLLKSIDRELSNELEHAHADMLNELMYEAYAQGMADSLKIARADLVIHEFAAAVRQ